MKFWNPAVFRNRVSLKDVSLEPIKHLLLVSSLLCAAPSAYSQEGELTEQVISAPPPANSQRSRVTEEVTVEAVKHDEDVQDISISITTLNSDTLEKKSIEGLTDIANFLPGLNFESYSSGGLGTPVIRGLTQNDITSQNQAVATYIDGIFIQRGYAIDPGVFELDGVDLLKGPQSASFGRNAFSGVINYRTKRPDLQESEGSFSVTVGSHDRQDYKFRASVPLIPDVLAVSAAYFETDFGGTWKNDWIDGFDFGRGDNRLNSFKGDLDFVGGHDNSAFSLALQAKPLPWLTISTQHLSSSKDEEFNANFQLNDSDLIVGSVNLDPGAVRQTTLDCGGDTGTVFICGQLSSDPRTYIRGLGAEFDPDNITNPFLAESFDMVGIPFIPRPGRVVLDPAQGQFNRTTGRTTTFNLNFKFSDNWSAEYLFGNIDAANFAFGTANVNDLFPSQSGIFNIINDGALNDIRRNAFTTITGKGPGGSNEITSNELRFDFDSGGRFRAAFGFYYAESVDRVVFENIVRIVNNGDSFNEETDRPLENAFVAQTDEAFFRSVGGGNNVSSFLENPGSTISDGFLLERSPFQTNVPDIPDSNPCAVLFLGFCDSSSRLIDSTTDDTIQSVFVKGDLDLFDESLNIIFEARYTEEDKDSVFQQFRRGERVFGTENRFETREEKRTFYVFTPRLIATYQVPFLLDSSLYVSAAKGVRAGGINEGALIDEEVAFDEETNWTYEIGSKNLFFDNTLRLNFAAFFTDWRDYQNRVAATRLDPIDVSVSITDNLGDIISKGVELDLGWQVTEKLTIDINGSYVESRFKSGTQSRRFRLGEEGSTQFLTGSSHRCQDTLPQFGGAPAVCDPSGEIGGNLLPRQSPAQGRLSVAWTDEILNGISFYASGDISYKSRSFLTEQNLGWIQSRTLINGNMEFSKKGLKLQFWAKNLLDKIYVSNSLVVLAIQEAYTPSLGARRTFGATYSVKFY